MKVLFSVANGAVSLVEDQGVFTFGVSEAIAAGGGKASGVLKVQGEGSVVLSGAMLLQLGEAFLNSKLPAAAAPVAQAVEGVINAEIASLE